MNYNKSATEKGDTFIVLQELTGRVSAGIICGRYISL